MDESSGISDDPTNTPNKPSAIVLPSLFYTKRPKTTPKITRFILFSKRKRSFIQSTNNDKNSNNSSLQVSTIPHYSTVNSNSNDYPINTLSVNNDNESPVEVYSKSNYPFPPHAIFLELVILTRHFFDKSRF